MDYWCKNINSFLSLRYFTKFTGSFKDYLDKIHERTTLIYVVGSDFIRYKNVRLITDNSVRGHHSRDQYNQCISPLRL